MKPFKKVAIIGVGLIGGSLGLALKKRKLAKEIIGVTRHRQSLFLARKKHAIDRGALDLKIIKGADLVIFSTPVSIILKLAGRVAQLVKKDCLVTDVGSTKEEIASKLEKLFPGYVGSHPLAGSEKRSIANATYGLFKGSTCILTPTPQTNPFAKKRIVQLWKACGAKVVSLSSIEHDKIIAFVSHLPHIAAFSLISAIPQEYLKFSATGLKDTTRIAASDSELWTDIFFSNKKILKSIDDLERSLACIKKAIRQKDKKSLQVILRAAKRKREILG